MDCQTQLVGYGYYNGYGYNGRHSPKLVRSYSLDRLNIEDPTSQNSEDDFNTIKDYKNSIQQLNYAREVQNKVVSKLKNVKLEVADYLSTEVDGSKNCFKQYKQIGTQYNVESVSRYCGTNVAISNRICEVGSQVELESKSQGNTSSTQTDPVSRRNSDVKLKIQRPESQHNIDTTEQNAGETERIRHRSAFTISAVLDQTNIEKCDTSSQTSDTPQVKEIIKEVFIEKIQQVPVEIIKKIEVPVEVIKEVPVNIIKEVPIEKIKIIKVPYVDKIKEQEHENNIKITKEALFKLQANEQILSAYSHAVQVLTAKLNNWEQGQFETISRTISGDSEGEDTLTGEQVEEVKKDTKLEISTVQVAEIEQALEKAAKPAVLKKSKINIFEVKNDPKTQIKLELANISTQTVSIEEETKILETIASQTEKIALFTIEEYKDIQDKYAEAIISLEGEISGLKDDLTTAEETIKISKDEINTLQENLKSSQMEVEMYSETTNWGFEGSKFYF